MTVNKKPRIKKQIFWTPLRTLLTAVVFALIAIAGISSCTSSDEKESRSGGVASSSPANSARPTPRKGNPPPSTVAATSALPENVRGAKLKTVGGGTISLADYSGKVVLINLWATWCGPCRMETPELVKLHKQFQSQGVEMVGLTTEDPTQSAESVKNFVKDYEVDYHVGWAPNDVAISLMQLNQRDAIPQSFIISRDGRVFRKFVGFNPMSTPPALKQAIEDALKGA